MPKSPVWLRSQRRYAEARLSLAWLNLPPQIGAETEPSSISIENQDTKRPQIEENNIEVIQSTETNFFTRPVMMPLGIGLTLLVLQQISGIDAIVFFTVEIFHASGTQQRRRKKIDLDFMVSFSSSSSSCRQFSESSFGHNYSWPRSINKQHFGIVCCR